uniref:TPX2_importin domain-containing protein n=1 Tax=Strongyloides venezuelensis TaxID=75913 RepID=A0A0K0FEC7_STRVS
MNQLFSNMKSRFMNTFVFKKDDNDSFGKSEIRIKRQLPNKKNEMVIGRQYNSDPATNPGLAEALKNVSKLPNNYYSVPKSILATRSITRSGSSDDEKSQCAVRPRSRTTLSEKANILENGVVVNKKKPKFSYGKQIVTSRKLRASFNKPKFVKCRSLDSTNMLSVKKGDLDFP